MWQYVMLKWLRVAISECKSLSVPGCCWHKYPNNGLDIMGRTTHASGISPVSQHKSVRLRLTEVAAKNL